MKRILCICKKETLHILRDPFTLALSLGLPLILLIVFGFAIEFNINEIRISVFDNAKNNFSSQILRMISSSNYFKLDHKLNLNEALSSLKSEKTKAALILEKDKTIGIKAQMLLDGADNSTIGPILGYLEKLTEIINVEIFKMNSKNPIEIRTKFLYNSELNSRWFVVPGLIVVILSILSILLISLTIAREWENGSMEVLLSTEIKPIEIILGKLIPYVVMGFIDICLVYLVARLVFGVPFIGSHLLFIIGVFLFLISALSQGLIISITTRNQRLAMQFSFVSGLLPAVLFSGFVFPIENMPLFFHYFTMIFPARWFMTISRGLFLKGSSFFALQHEFFALVLLDIILVLIAKKKFKMDLE